MVGFRRTLHWAVGTLVFGMMAAGLTGCAATTGIDGPPQVEFSLAPTEVVPGGPMVATLTLTNLSQRTVVFPGDPFCGGALSIQDGPPDDAMVGTRVFCIAVITETSLSPGEVRTWTWELRAQWDSGSDFEPGPYQLIMDWEAADLDAEIAPFEVVPG